MIEKGIEQLIEDSSLGTKEAKELRESIDLERARAIVKRAAELDAAAELAGEVNPE